jgi:hypothetical protein
MPPLRFAHRTGGAARFQSSEWSAAGRRPTDRVAPPLGCRIAWGDIEPVEAPRIRGAMPKKRLEAQLRPALT